MKIGITINSGNYESFKIDSSEHNNLIETKQELGNLLILVKDSIKLNELNKCKETLYFIERLNFWINRIKNIGVDESEKNNEDHLREFK